MTSSLTFSAGMGAPCSRLSVYFCALTAQRVAIAIKAIVLDVMSSLWVVFGRLEMAVSVLLGAAADIRGVVAL